MKASLRSATHFAPAYPAACIITRLARVTLVLALILAATPPSSAGDRRRPQRAVGSVFGWGDYFSYGSPTQLSGLSGVVAVADGRHSLILKSNGTVLARGWNDYGQLGNGTITTGTPVETPVQVSGLSDVVAVAVGETHSIALKSDGTVWTWGRNNYGQLGVAGGDQSTPVQVLGAGGVGFLTGVVAIAAGQRHSLALKNDGTVWAWGSNGYGQLGVSGGNSVTPVQVTAPSGMSGMVAIAAGNWHSVALSSDGTVWAWGYNYDGQLGMGGVGGGGYPNSTSTPQHVMSGSFSGVKKIASLQYHTLAVKSDGTVWAWGRNDYGQLGNGGTSASGTPVQAAGLSGMVDVAAGYIHSVALKSDGTVWTWGYNGYGQMGYATRDGDPHSTAAQVPGLSGVVAISAGVFSSLALQSQAIGAAWGDNYYGQVGDGSTGTLVGTPTQVSGLSGLAAIASGGTYNLARLSDGSLWTWGYNSYGLGNNTTSSPTPVQLASFAGTVAAIATGIDHSLVLKSDGTVWAWGFDFGTTPELQSGFSGTVALAGGGLHSLALRNDGTVWARGRNTYGQLGDGNTTTSYAPVQVIDPSDVSGCLTGVVAVAAGAEYSLALKSDGTVWSWGHNNYGQLGSGDTNTHITPVQVSGLSGVVAIAAGYEHGAALKSDGTVWVWGHNNQHQLGNGTTTDSPTPIQVSGLSTVAAIATNSGGFHTLALKGDGTLWGWGANNAWQLGPGVGGSTPTQLNGPWATSAIAAGTNHSLTMALSLTPPPTLTVTAHNQVMSYGGTLPTLTYTSDVTPLDTAPTCITSADSTSPVGPYTITCSGAAKAGYEITYVPGTLTVNPAPLTITAKDETKTYGMTLVWVVDASYPGSYITVDGLRNAGTVTSIKLTTAGAPKSAAVGWYAITPSAAAGTGLTNYDITYVPGTLTVTAAANPDLLTFNNNYFVTGDFVVGNVPLRGTGDVSGFATGTINIQSISSDPGNGVPEGADIVAAFLYWQRVEVPGSTPRSDGFFRNYAITGQKLGNDFPYPVTGLGSDAMRVYRANVLGYLPLDADGRRVAVGQHSVKLPDSGGGIPLTVGASLLIVYRVMSPAFPLKAVVVYDGAWVKTDGFQQMVRGFYDAVPGIYSKTVYLMAKDGYSAVQQAGDLMVAGAGPISQVQTQFEAVYGDSGSAVILSVPVNDSDHDGLLDAWEAGPPAGDLHAGQPGYYEVSDGSWVPLPGAVNGQKDMFVQLDYMCSTVNDDGTCDPANSRLPQPDPATGQDPLLMVQQAFDASGIKLHYLVGHAIQEETCTDDPSASPPRRCQFPGEPGVVGWKTGLEAFKVWARDPAACVAGNTDGCRPRFERGQKDSYHYVLFGESLAVAAWNTRARTLNSIVVSGGNATITTPARAPLKGNICPTRVTISGGLGAPELNGVYDVPQGGCLGNTSFTIATPGVGDWTYTKPSSPADEREPMLAVISGDISSISGYSDLGGADSAVTLGKWAPNPSQPQNTKPNVQAGTLMHELGHTIGLTHGGAYQDTAGSYALTFDANCKPNYQSIMNYMFQIDLLPGNVLAFSGQALDTMNENSGSANWTVSPAVSKTRWYVPWSSTVQGSPATRHCDGTPILNSSQMVREDQVIDINTRLTWTPGQDIDFDGQLNTALRGYNDLPNIDLRQVGASGAEYVSMAGLLGFGSGGTLTMGSGGTLTMGSGGTLTMGSGGTLALGSGGTLTMGSGGTLTMGSGGTLTMGSGGTITFGSGGTFTLGSGGTVVFGSGGGMLTLGTGGTLTLGTGGTLTLGSGGLFTMGSGGTLALGSGGTLTFGSGGGSITDSGGTQTSFGSGGTLALGSPGLLTMGSGGTLMLGSGGLLTLGSGGTFTMGSGGTFALGSGGIVTLGSGGTLTMGSGGLLTLGSGGTFTMGSGGTFALGSGGTLTMGSGGTFALGSGGTFTMGSGGTLTMGSGGTFALGSGGTLALGSGGTLALGSGGTLALGSGGTFALSSGGVMEEMTYETANSVVRPPSDVTKTPTSDGKLRIDWKAPSFGVVSEYRVYYRPPNSSTAVLVGTVSGDPPPTTFTVDSPVAGAVYFVTTTVPADSESTTARSSPPSDPLKDQTIAFSALPNKTYGDSDFTVSATASSGLPVSFSAAGNCTVTGQTVHLTRAGSCKVTASQAGNNVYKPALSVDQTFTIIAWTIRGFRSPVSMPQNGTPVWNVVKGGSTVPLKFNIYAGAVEQTALSTVSGGSVALYTVSCQPGAATEVAAVLDNTGSTSLRYDGTQFIQNWKTPSKAGLCYAVRMTARDGSMITGYFRTK